jgi:hypothetical protein
MARSDAITGKGLQHILDTLPDNFAGLNRQTLEFLLFIPR